MNTRWTPGLLAGSGFIVATGATVWGSLEKIQTYSDELPGTSVYRVTVTWWEIKVEGAAVDRTPYPPYGVLLAGAAGLLMVAAILAFAAFANRRDGLVTAARVSSALGVGLLVGAAGIRLMDGLQGVSQTNVRAVAEGHVVKFVIGLGIWLPGAATVLGLLGLIVLLAAKQAKPRNASQSATDR